LNQKCVKWDVDEPEELNVDDEAISDKLESDEVFPEELDAEEADLGTSHLYNQ
jgi:hypothetical protein